MHGKDTPTTNEGVGRQEAPATSEGVGRQEGPTTSEGVGRQEGPTTSEGVGRQEAPAAQAVEFERLAAIIAQVGAAVDPETALRVLLAGAIDLLGSEVGIARLYVPGTDQCVAHLYMERGQAIERRANASIPRPGSFTARLLAGGPPALVEDYAALDPQAYPVAPLVLARGIRSAVHVPIEAAGQRIGTLSLDHGQPGYFTARDLSTAATLAALAGAAIERARVETERQRTIERQAERLRALSEFARLVGSTLDLDSIVRVVIGQMRALFDCQATALFTYDATTDRLRFVARWTRARGLEVAPPGEWPPGTHGVGAAVRTRAPIVVQDTAQSPDPVNAQMAAIGIRSIAAVPVLVDKGVWGVLGISFAQPELVEEEDVDLLVSIAAHLAAAVHNAGLYASRQAALDHLLRSQRHIVQQERLRALGAMASGIAHDLNNALAPVVGYSELLLALPGALDDKATARRYLELIHTGATDAANVVGRLREFYRPREEDDVFDAVALPPLIEQVVALTRPRWRDQAQAAGRTVQIKLEPGETAPVKGDAAELREMLTNLVLNAVDAMPEGGSLTLRTGQEAEHVLLEVADTGIGMTDEVRLRCLEPFFSTKGEHGTGLGLAMVHGIVQRHSGRLEIDSAPGRGCTFRIWLPRADTTTHVIAPAEERPPAPLRILVVDDDQAVRAVTAAYLAADGHAVQEASNGAGALAALEVSTFDLIITDRAMPEMSGDAFAAAAKGLRPAVPIILLTGFGERMAAAGELPPGIDHVLGKPVRLTALRQAVAYVISRSAARDRR